MKNSTDLTDEMKMELAIDTFKEELLRELKKRGKKFACLCCENSFYKDTGRKKPDLVLFKDIEGMLNVR